MKNLKASAALTLLLALANVTTSANASTFSQGGNLGPDGYDYVIRAGTANRGGDGGLYSSLAGINPGTAYAIGSYVCDFDASGACVNYQQAWAQAKYTYRIEANATDAFFAETGIIGRVQIPLIYNWSLIAEGGARGGVVDASVSFTAGPQHVIRESGANALTGLSGTYKFDNGTNVTLTATVFGSGRAVADPFGGVDPDWRYAQFAHLIDIDTSPVIFDSVTDGISTVPLLA